MADENNNIAEAFGEAIGAEVEVVPEAGEIAQEHQTVELTPDPVEQTLENTPEEPQPEESGSDIQNEESSLTYDSHQDDDNYQNEPQEVEVDDDDALFVLNEKYGTDYESLDQMLDDLEAQKGEDYASEQIAQINRFVQETGRSAEDYLKTQTQDYNEMSDEKVIKEYLSLENPDLSSDEIDLFFDNTYKLNEKKYNSEQSKLGKIHLKRDVSRARQELKEVQEEYWSPEKGEDGYTQEEINQMDREADEEAYHNKENFLDAMDEELDDIESLTFEINNKGETFEYRLTEEDKQTVGQTMNNLDDFFSPYRNDNGEWDMEGLALDMIAMKLQNKIVRSVANQYRSQGTEQVLKDIKNPSFEPAKVSQSRQGDSFVQQISKHIFGD
tara:strand:- start:293 stop:1447 length:1155 start_codon:yes stop_codon:yes gene_type:complete